ncbi:MAG: hypothetical protein AAF197_05340, partial [Pseudomonadota bacterium]
LAVLLYFFAITGTEAFCSRVADVRIDKWLWAARFFKTRQLAIKALKNSQVKQGGQPLKPASQIEIGALLKLKRGHHEQEIEVLELSEQRGPASIAQTLYRETEGSIERREKLKAQMELQPRINIDPRKPDRRGLRESRVFKRNQ